MSAELLVMLAFLTLLPIIEAAVRKWREQRERDKRRAQGLPPEPVPPPVQTQAPPEYGEVPVPRRREHGPAPQQPSRPPRTRMPSGHEPLPGSRPPLEEELEEMIGLPPEARERPPRKRRVKDRVKDRALSPPRTRPVVVLASDAIAGADISRQNPFDAHAARRRSAMHRLLRQRASVRQGIVLMTILGPCRALDQHDAPRSAR
jgi:hypothetical protein